MRPIRVVRAWVLVVAAVIALVGCDGHASRVAPASSPDLHRLTVVSTTVLDDRMRDLSIYSPAVGSTVRVRLLLPADFDQTTRRIPVLYLLPGCCDSYDSWTRSTDIEALSAHTEVLIVMPDAGAVGFYSNWRHGPQWEDFHLVELPQILTRDYRASTVRAVAGVSMGGLGALDYAARHPSMFKAAASFSGIVDTRLTTEVSGGWEDLVSSQGFFPPDLWGDNVLNAALWKQHNPYDLAAKLRGTRLYISCGSGRPGPGDTNPQLAHIEAQLRRENDAFVSRLRQLHIPATVHLYDPGVHNWPYWQRELHRAWPMLMQSINASSVA